MSRPRRWQQPLDRFLLDRGYDECRSSRLADTKNGEIMSATFAAFRQAFQRTDPIATERVPLPPNALLDERPDFRALLDDMGGQALNRGIYRLLEGRLFSVASQFVATAFPAWPGRLVPFGCDWMGRIYAVDGSDRRVNGERSLCLLDPATRDLLDVPTTILEFHNDMLVKEPELPLEETLWRSWLSTHPGGLSYVQLAGWRRPGFLGGELALENLEIQPASVYWDLAGQMIAQVFKLPPGTHIREVTIS